VGYVVCTKCGTRIKAGREYCLRCGDALPPPDAPAIVTMWESLELSPADPDALFGRALVRLEQGRRPLAEEDARRLAGAHPRYPSLPYLRGRLFLAAGDVAGGRRELFAFLDQTRGVDPRLADSARKLLKELDERAPAAARPPR